MHQTLGVNMSDRTWEGIVNHARTCEVGKKIYLCLVRNYTLLLNSIWEPVEIMTDGMPVVILNDLNRSQKVSIQIITNSCPLFFE